MPRKTWNLPATDTEMVLRLASDLGVVRPIADVLVHRGFQDGNAARQFLHPQLRDLRDPFELPDMTTAVETILDAITRQQRITVYGDYDVDGITSSALLMTLLQAAGATVSGFLPLRMDEGYGLSRDGVSRCLKETRPDLLIAVDCGTMSIAEIEALNTKGVTVVVLDHHEPGEVLPPCRALVNPKRHDAPAASWSDLASVGVVFKLAHALLKRAREKDLAWAASFDLREHLDLVATGTVADIVPLTGENRLLVRTGLERLTRTGRVGLQALMSVAGVKGRVTPYHIGYRLGPRLNAAGRLADAQAALELLMTADPERANTLAQQLNAHNAERQQIEEQIAAHALDMARDDPEINRHRVIVVAHEDWHVGVIGIVASKLVQEFYKPSIVIGVVDGMGKGSCRGIPGFSMVTALEQCRRFLIKHGGHDMAAGLSIHPEAVDEFRRAINEWASHQLADEAMLPVLHVDAELTLAEMNDEFFRQLRWIEPCGTANPTPVFMTRHVRIEGEPRVLKEKHLKFPVTDGQTVCDAIWWNQAEAGLPAGEFEIAYHAELSEYRGVETVQLNVRDIRHL